MTTLDLTKHLVSREHELERKRSTSLARQRWGDVIDLEARIDECEKLRKHLAQNEPTPTPTPVP